MDYLLTLRLEVVNGHLELLVGVIGRRAGAARLNDHLHLDWHVGYETSPLPRLTGG